MFVCLVSERPRQQLGYIADGEEKENHTEGRVREGACVAETKRLREKKRGGGIIKTAWLDCLVLPI